MPAVTKRNKTINKLIRPTIFVTSIILLGASFITTRIPVIAFEEGRLNISGHYGLSKSPEEIIVIDTTSILPNIIEPTKGFHFLKTYVGEFAIDNDDKAQFFIKEGVTPYIYIEYKRANKVYFNYADAEQTKEFYRFLRVKKDNGSLP